MLFRSINAWRQADAGEYVIPAHTEVMAKHEELYLVLSGHATFTVDGEEVDAPAGTLVFVPGSDTRRGAVARNAGTTILVVGARPGEAFTVSPWEESWEENQRAMALYGEKRYREAANVLVEATQRRPDAAGLHYNLACFESLAGSDPDVVAGHLRRAVELYPGFRDLARADTDFDPVREKDQFQEVMEA